MNTFPQTKALLTLGAAFLTVSAARGQTVAWGSDTSLTPIGYFSDATVGGSSLIWTLGYFQTGFIPTATNFADWATNYVTLDAITETANPFYKVDGIVSNVGPTAAGRQVWMFAYNSLAAIGTEDGEALLFSEVGTTYPSEPNSISFDIADNPFQTVDDVFNVVWGQVDRDRGAIGGRIVGAGIFSNQFADTSTNSWEAQTATWPASPIPEPSVAALACLGTLALLRRNRSSR